MSASPRRKPDEPIPAQYVSVGSGTSADGPPLRVIATAVDRDMALGTPDIGCDTIVITLLDHEIAAEEIVRTQLDAILPGAGALYPWKGAPAEVTYALKLGDARQLCIALLHHLAYTGEPMARGLVECAPEVFRKIQEARGTLPDEEGE
jgi:hypothetical protein